MRGGFGEFTFDTDARELVRDATPLHLSPKAFDLLQLLITERPRALSKEEILDRVWEAAFVSDGTLSVVVAELRSILGDDPRQPRFIRTVHRFGYAFCGMFEPLTDPAQSMEPAFRLLWGEREISLSTGRNILGRCREAVVWIEDSSISRRHAMIEISAEGVVIHDLGSKNGTFINGRRVSTHAALADGDPISLGRVPMVFRVFRDGGPTASVHSASL